MAHLFPQLDRWVQGMREALRAEVKQKIGL
jgi:hypothetical protein